MARLFSQWQTFYGEVTGFGRGTTQIRHKGELREFAKGMGVSLDALDTPLLFFTVHTYFSLLVKLIAYLALSRFVPGFGTRFGSLYSLDDDALAKEMGELERGGLFRRLGIRNFLEGDFFAGICRPGTENWLQSCDNSHWVSGNTTLELSRSVQRRLGTY